MTHQGLRQRPSVMIDLAPTLIDLLAVATRPS